MKYEKRAQGVYYLSKNGPLGRESIRFLEKQMEKENLNIGRICIHDNEESTLMAMLIMIRNGFTYPAHRHKWKDECYTIIEGLCNYIEYSESGKILSSHALLPGDTFINKNKNFHALVPSSNKGVFLESTVGPFKAQQLEFL